MENPQSNQHVPYDIAIINPLYNPWQKRCNPHVTTIEAMIKPSCNYDTAHRTAINLIHEPSPSTVTSQPQLAMARHHVTITPWYSQGHQPMTTRVAAENQRSSRELRLEDPKGQAGARRNMGNAMAKDGCHVRMGGAWWPKAGLRQVWCWFKAMLQWLVMMAWWLMIAWWRRCWHTWQSVSVGHTSWTLLLIGIPVVRVWPTSRHLMVGLRQL